MRALGWIDFLEPPRTLVPARQPGLLVGGVGLTDPPATEWRAERIRLKVPKALSAVDRQTDR